MEIKCKKCESNNLQIVQSGPHQKLICGECLAFQKFVSKAEAKTFAQTHEAKDLKVKHWEDGSTTLETPTNGVEKEVKKVSMVDVLDKVNAKSMRTPPPSPEEKDGGCLEDIIFRHLPSGKVLDKEWKAKHVSSVIAQEIFKAGYSLLRPSVKEEQEITWDNFKKYIPIIRESKGDGFWAGCWVEVDDIIEALKHFRYRPSVKVDWPEEHPGYGPNASDYERGFSEGMDKMRTACLAASVKPGLDKDKVLAICVEELMHPDLFYDLDLENCEKYTKALSATATLITDAICQAHERGELTK